MVRMLVEFSHYLHQHFPRTARLFEQVLHVLHLGLLVFVLLAWMLPFPNLLVLHLLLIPALLLHWKTNENTCVMTNMTEALAGKKDTPKKQQGVFIKSLLKKFIDPLPSDRTIQYGIWGMMAGVWLASVSRVSML